MTLQWPSKYTITTTTRRQRGMTISPTGAEAFSLGWLTIIGLHLCQQEFASLLGEPSHTPAQDFIADGYGHVALADLCEITKRWLLRPKAASFYFHGPGFLVHMP